MSNGRREGKYIYMYISIIFCWYIQKCIYNIISHRYILCYNKYKNILYYMYYHKFAYTGISEEVWWYIYVLGEIIEIMIYLKHVIWLKWSCDFDCRLLIVLFRWITSPEFYVAVQLFLYWNYKFPCSARLWLMIATVLRKGKT